MIEHAWGPPMLPGMESTTEVSAPKASEAARTRVKPVDRSQLTWQMLDVERLIEERIIQLGRFGH